ncbi:MAG: hypothetical protein MUE96_02920 [Bacteroidia bacterium]|nr:hypothetical protein [Bacteroidia bacterium]
MNSNKRQKNTALFIALSLLFGYPLLSIVNTQNTIGHIPVLFVYIAIVWVVSIILLYVAAEIKPFRKSSKQPHE